MTCLAALFAAVTLAISAMATPRETAIELLCFNIRYDNPGDGEHAWPHRRAIVVETIRDRAPDLIGLQEALPHQRREIEAALASGAAGGGVRYGSIGRTREASAVEGEATPLLHREDRWQRLDGGTFWLSKTPETAGSRDWNAACPRIATWGRFRRRDAAPMPEPPPADVSAKAPRDLLVVNTHFDHASAEARREGAKVLVEFVSRVREAHPSIAVIVMGDFNAASDDAAVTTLLATGLVDTHRAAGGDERFGTFHGFKGAATTAGRSRIDFILADPSFEVIAASIDRREPDGAMPSDHLPVRATLRLLDSSPSRGNRTRSSPINAVRPPTLRDPPP